MERVHNFSAGPATLPLAVLEQVKEGLPVYPGAGASVMEISHRSKAFAAIHEQAKSNIQQLLDLPDNYKVLFIQGGASLQFSMLAMNFLKGGTADYINTGSWAQKAISEAKVFGTPNVVWDGADDNYNRVPGNDELNLSADAEYVHYCANETIQGIEFASEPDVGDKALLCDASSNFLSKPIDITKYAMLYAGAQKNVGPAGVAVVIIRGDMLERVPDGLASLLDYRVIAEGDSLVNTPPCWGIYIISLTTQWMLDQGGLAGIKQNNDEKAKLIYDAIDNSGGFYKGHATTDCRSNMNVTFTLANSDLESTFVAQATAAGLDGLQGHRSVGGCRASIYNAMEKASCQALVDFMVAFQQKNG